MAIFHQLLFDEWMTGSLSGPLARIKVDEKNCSGMIEWKAVREAASRFLPKHTAAAVWKHRNVSFVEQEGLSPMPKDRGAEQGDVDGPLECSLALGISGSRGAREHKLRGKRWEPSPGLASMIRRGAASTSRLRSKSTRVSQLSAWWPRSAHRCSRPAASTLQKNGGLADQWYMDDGDIMCHPILVLPFLQDFDVANARVGAERNPLKTEVIHYVNDMECSTARVEN